MKKLISTITLTALLVSSAVAIADKSPEKQLLRGFKQLSLSTEQKNVIKTTMQNAKAERDIYLQDRKDVKQDLNTLMANTVWDKEAATAVLSQKVESDKQARLIAAKAKHAAYQVLTTEQKAKLEEMQVDRQAKRAARDMTSSVDNTQRKTQKKQKGGIHKAFRKLDLTDEQKAQLQLVREASKAFKEANSQDMEALKAAERALIQADNFDQSAWVSLYENNQDVLLVLELQKAKNKFDSLAVLTADQRAKFAKIQMRQKQKRKQA